MVDYDNFIFNFEKNIEISLYLSCKKSATVNIDQWRILTGCIISYVILRKMRETHFTNTWGSLNPSKGE